MPKQPSILDLASTGPRREFSDEYWDDLRTLVKAVQQGKDRPPFPAINDWMRQNRGVNVTASTTRNHYRQIEQEVIACQDK